MHYSYKTSNTCSQIIEFDIEGNVITNVKFHGGCDGNLQAISKVTDGMTVEEIESHFTGINCRGRGTSCSDQLARAVRKAYEEA